MWWTLLCLLLFLEQPSKPLLMWELVVFACLAMVRLPETTYRLQWGREILRDSEDGHRMVITQSVRCLRQSLRWTMATSMASLIMYSLKFLLDNSCQAAGPRDASATICHVHLAACGCFLGAAACFFLFSAAVLSVMPRLIHVSREGPAPQHLSREHIDKLVAYDFGDPRAPQMSAQCMICLEDFKQGEKIRCLPCGHDYHAHCVDAWLSVKANCPMRCHVDLEAACTVHTNSGIASLDSGCNNQSHAVYPPAGVSGEPLP
mmetsp:Transcript_21316/g.28746  ORF Transcript_21316/g.28746 Transcript_21316/m.28746 type:complete len:261 (+) Transcript_21316:3-785(+)